MFELVKNINMANPKSWQNEIFLTFDIDWSNNKVLEFLLDIMEEHDVKATFFATHKTELLKILKKNKNFELGIIQISILCCIVNSYMRKVLKMC